MNWAQNSCGAKVANNAVTLVIKAAPAIYEICIVTEPLKKLIMQKRDGGELKQCAIAEGMETSGRMVHVASRTATRRSRKLSALAQTDEVMAETTEDAEFV